MIKDITSMDPKPSSVVEFDLSRPGSMVFVTTRIGKFTVCANECSRSEAAGMDCHVVFPNGKPDQMIVGFVKSMIRSHKLVPASKLIDDGGDDWILGFKLDKSNPDFWSEVHHAAKLVALSLMNSLKHI